MRILHYRETTMQRVRCFDVTDVHIGGEVHRIILGGVAPVPGVRPLDKAHHLETHADGLRRLLLYEPRGGLPSVSADLVVEPHDPRAQAGIVIMECMGYPLYSGSNIMASVIALLDAGRPPMIEGEQSVTIEAPGGLAEVLVESHEGRVTNTTYTPNTIAYVAYPARCIDVPRFGPVVCDVVWSGVFYAVVEVQAHGFSLTREEEAALSDFGNAFIESARAQLHPTHPELGDMGPLSFALLAGPATRSRDRAWEQRVASYVHPRSLCRCPSGTGTTAAMVQLASRHPLDRGDRMTTTSWFGSSFVGTVTEVVEDESGTGLVVSTASPGWVTARSEIVVDLDDPLTAGPGLEVLLNCAARG